ncbi:MAG: hypothetical protein ACRDOD_07470 [Streptosporangiaceae bacterium]
MTGVSVVLYCGDPQIVPPGTDVGTLDQAYVPPAIQKTELRRRPPGSRSAAARSG